MKKVESLVSVEYGEYENYNEYIKFHLSDGSYIEVYNSHPDLDSAVLEYMHIEPKGDK